MVLYHTYLRFDDLNEASEITHTATVNLNIKEGNFYRILLAWIHVNTF